MFTLGWSDSHQESLRRPDGIWLQTRGAQQMAVSKHIQCSLYKVTVRAWMCVSLRDQPRMSPFLCRETRLTCTQEAVYVDRCDRAKRSSYLGIINLLLFK